MDVLLKDLNTIHVRNKALPVQSQRLYPVSFLLRAHIKQLQSAAWPAYSPTLPGCRNSRLPSLPLGSSEVEKRAQNEISQPPAMSPFTEAIATASRSPHQIIAPTIAMPRTILSRYPAADTSESA